MQDTPVALWILGGMAVLAVLAAFVMIVRNKGAAKYGMSFFKSISFALLFLGAVFFIAMAVLVRVIPHFDPVNYEIAQMTGIITIFAALIINIKKSSPPFGIIYTIAQALTAYSIILTFIGLKTLKKISD